MQTSLAFLSKRENILLETKENMQRTREDILVEKKRKCSEGKNIYDEILLEIYSIG